MLHSLVSWQHWVFFCFNSVLLLSIHPRCLRFVFFLPFDIWFIFSILQWRHCLAFSFFLHFFSFMPVISPLLFNSITLYSHISKFVHFIYCFLSHQQHFKLFLLSFSVFSSILSIQIYCFFIFFYITNVRSPLTFTFSIIHLSIILASLVSNYSLFLYQRVCQFLLFSFLSYKHLFSFLWLPSSLLFHTNSICLSLTLRISLLIKSIFFVIFFFFF